jgi:hypothetical protein
MTHSDLIFYCTPQLDFMFYNTKNIFKTKYFSVQNVIFKVVMFSAKRRYFTLFSLLKISTMNYAENVYNWFWFTFC